MQWVDRWLEMKQADGWGRRVAERVDKDRERNLDGWWEEGDEQVHGPRIGEVSLAVRWMVTER